MAASGSTPPDLGTPPPLIPSSTEHARVLRIDAAAQSPLVAGATYHLVSARWLRAWRARCLPAGPAPGGEDDAAAPHVPPPTALGVGGMVGLSGAAAPRAPPTQGDVAVDSSDLAEPSHPLCVRRGLSVGADYELLPEDAYAELVQWCTARGARA